MQLYMIEKTIEKYVSEVKKIIGLGQCLGKCFTAHAGQCWPNQLYILVLLYYQKN